MGRTTEATTPESTTEDEVPLSFSPPTVILTKPWYFQYPPPYAILSVSVFQLITYAVASDHVNESLRFDPNNQIEAWRFLTYMFLHRNLLHAALNVVIQSLFAIALEKNQKRLVVLILYFGSGAIGALGSACARPDLIVGASGGVYGLLISHLSHLILNFNLSKYKVWTVLTVMIIVASDVTYYFLHSAYNNDLIISEGAHIGGAIAGFLLGLLLYRSKDQKSIVRNKVICWSAFAVLLVFMLILIIINVLIKKCTPTYEIRIHYTYMC